MLQAPHNEVRLSIVGDDLALEYFTINSRSGQLFQRRSVLTDPDATKQYTVLISATDLGLPDACASERNATVNVRVARNEHAPVFSDDGRYERSINEDTDVMSVVTTVRASDRDDKVRISFQKSDGSGFL